MITFERRVQKVKRKEHINSALRKSPRLLASVLLKHIPSFIARLFSARMRRRGDSDSEDETEEEDDLNSLMDKIGYGLSDTVCLCLRPCSDLVPGLGH